MSASELGNQGFSYSVDLVFCIDATASMTPLLTEVKANALRFNDALAEQMAADNLRVDQLRVKVVAFRDFLDDPTDALVQSDFFALPQDREAFDAFVAKLEPVGGGDAPESGLEALAVAMTSDWERGFDKRRHVIVMFTDTSAHPIETAAAAGLPNYPTGVPTSFSELSDYWNGEGQAKSMDPRAKRLVLFAPEADPWSEISADWNEVIHLTAKAGEGMREEEFSAIIATISGTLS